MSRNADTVNTGSRRRRTRPGAARVRHGGEPAGPANRKTVVHKILYVAIAVIVISGGVIGMQTARVDAASAEADYLRLRLHAVLGIAELREEVIQLHRTLHDAESSYIRALHGRLERAALRAYIQRINPRALVDKIADSIQACAQQHAVEPQLVLAVMQQESYFNHKAVGGHGERGLMQLTFSTAGALGVRWDKAFDVETNICAGTKLLSELIARYGAPETAAQHYNGGGDPLYAMRISQHLLRISREFPRNELAPQQAEILASLARSEAAQADDVRGNF
jgi:soluble lytic murein transglycosylase-like protein